MPPKKPKGKGKGGKAKSKGVAASPANNALPYGDVVNRKQMEVKVMEQKQRIAELRAENAQLKRQHDKSERDTHEFVAYFQKEMMKKDDQIASQNDTLMRKELQFERELATTKEDFEAKITTLERAASEERDSLQGKLKVVSDELGVYAEFKQMKVIIERKMEEKDRKIREDEIRHKEEITKLERKYLEEKARMQKEQEARIKEIERKSHEEARQNLDADTRKIVADNRRMGEELRFQLQTSEELQREKKKFEEKASTLARDIALAQEKETLYARRGQRQKKEIQDLTMKVKSLERSLSQVVRDFEKEREMLVLKAKEDTEELKMNSAALKQMVKMKNRELKNVRKLAQAILDQRTEVEQYFHEALDQVKSEIQHRRQEQYKQTLATYNNQMRAAMMGKTSFPSIKAPHQHDKEGSSGFTKLPTMPNGKVDLRDLDWEDRERVLRLLFAKINGVQGYVELGKNPDAIPSLPAAGAYGGEQPELA